ncbi:glycosyl transferase family protein [Alteromonas halophila]|uniref:Bacteriophage N4 adsorption protein B n=1 Tax=Alteromonas halophila TaxID=516698 RepID=A0A918JP28_9ALTE|nr:glycosyl transferase family protein [Alteromonas halophila]GGW91950.1 bacteriophage N4 adsorption protein B [Alteromonas halophila]
MSFVEVFTHYLFGIRYLALVLMVCMLMFALDDIFVDVYYWARRFWRRLTVYRNRDKFDENALFQKKEKPLAIMVPAWQEVGVVAKMAELAASELDYENYQIFVGTYPNDPDTQNDVDSVCQRFPNVHKVVCARPGPTSKADCLNNVIASILEFEKRTRVKFEGFILHDAEDVVSAMELRLFNYLLDRKDLIQLPVYPFSRSPWRFTAGHYLDEFSEMHGKDMVVREAMVGQVPSAGVGTCFSRRAILRLTEEGDGLTFDIQSLTEDYDIGFRMKQWGMEEIFVHFSVTDKKYATFAEQSRSRSYSGGNVVCVREYFPESLSTAVRQKSRWIVGIVFQGIQVHKWSEDWKLNYFLWRDRKGVIAHFLSFLATLVAIHVILLGLYDWLFPESYRFLSIFTNDALSVALIQINFAFFINRIFQRAIFVRRYYGITQALVSPIRLFWGNLINFLANLRAIRQVIEQGGNPRRVAWDKTEHEYPTVSDRALGQSLGSILVAKGVLTEDKINFALENRRPFERLGQALQRMQLVSADNIGKALAEQAKVEYRYIDPFAIDEALLADFSDALALKYRVLPVAKNEKGIEVASENRISPIALASLSRKLNKQVTWVMCQTGAVTLGIRYHYQGVECNPEPELNRAVEQGLFDADVAKDLKEYFYSLQIQFGDAIQQAGFIEAPVFNQIILDFDFAGDMRLGDYLVQEGVVSQDVVDSVIEQQKQRQLSIGELIDEYLLRPGAVQ